MMSLRSVASAESAVEAINAEFPDAAHRPSPRDLPSLDGLRAISIGFVILGHASEGRVSPLVAAIFSRLAHFGVCVFFVISGYLITTLLRREAERSKNVSLRRFYLRRTLRIFPPYYLYLAVIALGVTLGCWTLPSGTRWWPALTYLTNIFGTTWLLGHGWSLSIEEQFYVTWPIVLATCIRRRGTAAGSQLASRIAWCALLGLPVLRVLVFGITRDGVVTTGLIFDFVAAGSALALVHANREWDGVRSILNRILRSGRTPLVAIVALVLHLSFTGTIRWMFAIDIVVVTPIEAVLLALFVAWAVVNSDHLVGRALNVRALRLIGIGSYSLYIWQQLFLGPRVPLANQWPLLGRLIAVGTCAATSYFLVERPALRLRARIEHTKRLTQ